MNYFNLDFKKLIIMMLVVLPPLLFFNLQTSPDETAWYKRPFNFLTSLAQSSYYDLSSSVKGTTAHYLNLLAVKTENRQLKQEALELKARLLQFEEISAENQRLRNYMQFAQKTKMQLLAARVIGRDPISDQITLTINRGKQHGIVEGMAVITTDGAVGYVFRPELLTSQVLVLTDRYAVIDAVVLRSRARGIVEGKTAATCALRYLERNDDIQVGDLVVTSGLDNIFPKGLPIGKITNIEKEYFGTHQKVDLEPIIVPSQLDEVFVVTDSKNEDITPQQADEMQDNKLDAEPGAPAANTSTPEPSPPPSALNPKPVPQREPVPQPIPQRVAPPQVAPPSPVPAQPTVPTQDDEAETQ